MTRFYKSCASSLFEKLLCCTSGPKSPEYKDEYDISYEITTPRHSDNVEDLQSPISFLKSLVETQDVSDETQAKLLNFFLHAVPKLNESSRFPDILKMKKPPAQYALIQKARLNIQKILHMTTYEGLNDTIGKVLEALGPPHWILFGFLCAGVALNKANNIKSKNSRCLELLRTYCIISEYLIKSRKDLEDSDNDTIKQAWIIAIKDTLTCVDYVNAGGFTIDWNSQRIEDHVEESSKLLQSVTEKLNQAVKLRSVKEIPTPIPTVTPTDAGSSTQHALQHFKVFGLDQEIEEVEKKLNLNGEERAVAVVVWGCEGLGKSTLVGSSIEKFSSLISQEYKYSQVNFQDAKNEISKVQEHMVRELKGIHMEINDTDMGRKELQKIFETHSCFVFIDNVNDASDMADLLPKELSLNVGTKLRLIITSRHKGIGDFIPSLLDGSNFEIREHERKPLSALHSQQMLAHKVAVKGERSVDAEETQFISKVADLCHGIPILLEVLGKNIRQDKSVSKYNEMVNVLLEQNFNDSEGREASVENMLWFVYNKLELHLQQAFLLAYMLLERASKWDSIVLTVGEKEIQQLIDKGIVNKEGDKVVIHDTFKIIAKKETQTAVITSPQHLQYAIKRKEGKVLGIRAGNTACSIRASDLDEINSELHFLADSSLGTLYIDGKCKKAFKNLRYVKMDCGTAFPFESFEGFEKLAWVDLKEEKLAWKQSPMLTKEVIQSICKLPSLKSLHLSVVGKNIESLPKEFECLEALAVLELKGFRLLKTLPSHKFAQLHDLHLQGWDSLETFSGLGRMESLSSLHVHDCQSLENLSGDIVELKNLRKFSIRNCKKVKALPSGFYQLKSLAHLEICGCPVQELSEDIGNLSSLQECELENLELKVLPDNLAKLSKLKKLRLEELKIETLPKDFSSLVSLTMLKIIKCRYLSELPDDMGKLPKLNQLLLFNNDKLCTLATSFCELSNLEEVEITKCCALPETTFDQVLKCPSLRDIFLSKDDDDILVTRWKCFDMDQFPHVQVQRSVIY